MQTLRVKTGRRTQLVDVTAAVERVVGKRLDFRGHFSVRIAL
jgi:thiamine phosphate synthase YjbQ (UPF0047 family)